MNYKWSTMIELSDIESNMAIQVLERELNQHKNSLNSFRTNPYFHPVSHASMIQGMENDITILESTIEKLKG